MIFYSTDGDRVPAVLKTQISLPLLSKHHADGKSIVCYSPNRDHAPAVVIFIILTGGLLFTRVLKDTMLQLLL